MRAKHPEIDLSAEYKEDINELETTCYLAGTCDDENDEDDKEDEAPDGGSNPGEGGGGTGEGGGDAGPAPQE